MMILDWCTALPQAALPQAALRWLVHAKVK
jgi:hypothetical protein